MEYRLRLPKARFVVWVVVFMGASLNGLNVNLTWRGWVSWESWFHQGTGDGGVSPVETLVWGREEDRERRII